MPNQYSKQIRSPNTFLKNLLLLLILFFLLGPNIKIGGFELQYWFFYFFLITAFLSSILLLESTPKIPIIFYIPMIIAILSFILKYIYGQPIIFRDLLNTLRFVNLFLIFYATVLIIKYYSVEHISNLLNSVQKIVLFSGIIISLIGLLQYFNLNIFNNPIIRLMYEYRAQGEYGIYDNFEFADVTNRLTSIYTSPIALGGIISIIIIVIFSRTIQKGKIINWIVLLLCVIILFLTNARAAIVGAIFGILYITYHLKNLTGKIRLIILSILSIIIFSYFLFSLSYKVGLESNERLSELVTYISTGIIPSTAVGRIQNLMIILYYLIDKTDFIITGIPAIIFQNNFTYFFSGNQYFQWFFEYGILGVMLSIWLIYMIYYYYKQFKTNVNPDVKKINIMLSTLFVVSNILSISQTSGLAIRWREILFILMAISWVYQEKYKMDTEKSI